MLSMCFYNLTTAAATAAVNLFNKSKTFEITLAQGDVRMLFYMGPKFY